MVNVVGRPVDLQRQRPLVVVWSKLNTQTRDNHGAQPWNRELQSRTQYPSHAFAAHQQHEPNKKDKNKGRGR